MNANAGRSRSATRRKNVSRSRRLVVGWVVGLSISLVAGVVWVGTRAGLSYSELAKAQELVSPAVQGLADGDGKADAAALAGLRRHLSSASSTTGDPVWMLAEAVPVAGGNLKAFRQTVDALTDAVDGAVVPLVPLAPRLSSAISFENGTIDLAAISGAAPAVSRASSVLRASLEGLDAARESATLPPLEHGAESARSLISQLSRTVSAVDIAASVLPTALGESGATRYAILLQNNAEVRTSGGIAGAISELTSDNGALALGRQFTPADFGDPAPLPLDDDETSLFGPVLGTYIQDVNLTPDFRRSGQLTAAMWQRAHGDSIDGVIAVDAVSLSHLLEAVGPVTVDGVTLTPQNATTELLSSTYQRLRSPAQQDEFFAHVTSAVFEQVVGGEAEPRDLLDALLTSAGEGRISVWLADGRLDRKVAGTSVAGPLARLTSGDASAGVFLNDATGAKMSYYLDSAPSVKPVCRARTVAGFDVTTILSSKAPADAAGLPGYVTGGGMYGVPVGSIQTQVVLVGNTSARLETVSVDGTPVPVRTTLLDGLPVAVVMTELVPGRTATIVARFVPARDGADAYRGGLETTPTVSSHEPALAPVRCE